MTERAAKVSNPILKAKEFPNSRRFAINAKCAECMGCTQTDIEPGFRKNIRECTTTSCALHSFRPYQHGEETEEQILELETA